MNPNRMVIWKLKTILFLLEWLFRITQYNFIPKMVVSNGFNINKKGYTWNRMAYPCDMWSIG